MLSFPLLVPFTPLLLLYLTFLEHFVFLRDIQEGIFLVSICGTAYLLYATRERLNKAQIQKSMWAPDGTAVPHHRLQPEKISRIVLILSVCFTILYASGAIAPAHPITGDEPHYLLITRSLLSDGDTNLFNNYRNKDYLQFYPGELESHARPGKKGHGYEYSKHTPGLPLMLIPPFLFGENLGKLVAPLAHDPTLQPKILVLTLRISMAIVAALLCWIFFLFARDFTKNPNVAFLSWLIFAVTSPLLFYSHLIYPEIPASLIMIIIFYRFLSRKALSPLSYLWIGLGTAFLPWLGVKYIILSLGLFGIVLTKYWKSSLKKGRNTLLFLAPLLVSGGLFLFHLWSLYGNIWPSSLYRGYLPSGSSPSLAIFHLRFNEFFRWGLSYLFDQRIGIFPYSPIYLIAIPGAVILLRERKPKIFPLIGIFILYWGFCSLAYYTGGYCPPGRTLLPVLWILALFMAAAIAWGKNSCSIPVQRLLLFSSIGVSIIGAKNPMLLYHQGLAAFLNPSGRYSNLLNSLSNTFVNFRITVPSLINRDFILWTPLIFWMMALAFFCVIHLKKERASSSVQMALKKPLIVVMFFSILYLAYTFFDIHLDRAFIFRDKPYMLFFQDTHNFGQELQGFWTKGRNASEVLVKTDTQASEIRVKLSSPAPGKATIRVGREKRTVPRSPMEGQEKTLIFPSPVGFPWKGGDIYSIRVKENSGFSPYQLDPKVQDNRFLGIFVEIDVELRKKQGLDRTQ